MRRLILFLYRVFFGLRLQANTISIGDLERMREDLELARDHVAAELFLIERRLDEAIEQRIELIDRIEQGQRRGVPV